MPTTEELALSTYDNQRIWAVKAISNAIIDVCKGFADLNLTENELCDLLSEIEEYSTAARKEEKQTSYDNGLLRGAGYAATPKKEENDPTNLIITDISTLIAEREADFIAFCQNDPRNRMSDKAKMTQYLNSQKKYFVGVKIPDDLINYHKKHPDVYPTENARKGLSKTINLLDSEKISRLNGCDLDSWKKAVSKMLSSEDAKRLKLIAPETSDENSSGAKNMPLSDFKEFYANVEDDYKAFVYLCALSGIRYTQLHKFLLLPKEEKRQLMSVIYASDEKSQLNYNNKLVGDVLVIDLRKISSGTKELAYAVLPAECEKLILSLGYKNLHNRPETYSIRVKSAFDNINKRRQTELSAVEFDGNYSLKTLRKFHNNYLLIDLNVDESTVDLLQGRGLNETVGRSNYQAVLKRCIIAYSPIADKMLNLVEFPPLPRNNDHRGKRK